MINRVNMDGVKPYGDSNILPKGGYVMKILGVTVKQNRVGQYLELSCDVCEGEYKFSGATKYRTSHHYYYTCENCDHTIELNSLMK